MDNNIIIISIGALIGVWTYYIYKEVMKRKKAIRLEIDQILNADEYKVKGKYELDR